MTPVHTSAFVGVTLAIGAAAFHGYYPDGPPPGHTGGFGEPTCRVCHFEHALNAPGASLDVEGWPDEIIPDALYRLTVRVGGEGIGAAGFQMSARFASGLRAGSNAGMLKSIDDRTAVRRDARTGIAYAQHVESSIAPSSGDVVEWVVDWVAPSAAEEAILLHVAANAANGDASEFGDRIYALERVINGGKIDGSLRNTPQPQDRFREHRCGAAGGHFCSRSGPCSRRRTRS